MPNSLRAKIKKWHYQGLMNDTDRDRLIRGLDMIDSVEQIKADIIAEIEDICAEEIDIDQRWTAGLRYSLRIIDKYTKVITDD